ncbi:MAG: hypothetical protein P8Y49_08285, partial [Sulfurovaceae bacterium]
PDEIKTTREGNNLKVEIKDGDATSTTIIEDYYTNGEGDLIGLAEDGHFYNFVPEEMGNDYMVTDLADGVSSFQALGSEGDSMSPWWLGLPLLALGAAGGGGGSGAANTLDTTAPDAPSVTMVTDDYDEQEGYDRWGADDDRGSWSFDSATGEWSVSGGNVNLVDGVIVTNDTTPTFTISEKEAGSTMEVYDYDAVAGTYTLVESTTTENLDGTWSVTINEETAGGDSNVLSNGEHTLFLVERDAANNALDPENGTQINLIIDTVLPDRNESVLLSDGVNSRESNSPEGTASSDYIGMNKYFSSELIISDDVLNSSIFGDSDYSAGDSIYIKLTVTEEDGTTATYLIGGPDGPTTTISNDGDPWSVTINNTNAYNVASGANETLADGEYSAEIVVYEASGNVRDTGITNFAIDTTAPTVNDVEYVGTVTNDSNVSGGTVRIGGEIADYEKLDLALDNNNNGIAERDIDYLTGTTAAEIFIYRDGVEVGSKYVGTYEDANDWSFNETLSDGVYKYQVDTMDVAGNTSGLGDSFWVVVDNGGTHSYDLTEVDGTAGKDFEHMVLIGNNSDETFTLDNVSFGSIDGGAGTDTLQFDANLTLDSNSGEIKGFEVFDVGNNTLIINDAQIENGMFINGSGGNVALDATYWVTDGSSTIVDTVTYDIYTHGTDTIYVQDSLL